ncbi:MAG: class IV adenylate cyclase [bacterium]
MTADTPVPNGYREIEAKILEVDRRRLEVRLAGMGAKRVFEADVEALFYDFTDGSIGMARDLVRLRREGERSVLTYKRFVGDSVAKTRAEFEVVVSDFDTTRAILEALKLRCWLRMTKSRISYTFDRSTLSFDRYTGEHSFIPEFLEIEARSAAAIHRIAGLLGFKPEDCRPWGFGELISYYSDRKPHGAGTDQPGSGR